MYSEQSLWTISINAECNFDPQNPGNITEWINNVLNWFNTQLLIVLWGLNRQKKQKGWKELKLKIVKLLFKNKGPSKDLIEQIKDSFEKILEIAKELEKPIPSVFGNLININDNEWWERVFSIWIQWVHTHALIWSKKGWNSIQVVIDQKIKAHVPKALIKMSESMN